MKKILTITGITSDSCAEKISKNLFSLPETEEIIVDIENGKIELILESPISDDLIKAALKSAGKYEILEIR